MGLVSKFIGSGSSDDNPPPDAAEPGYSDGAIDTLATVVSVMGKQSFPLEDDFDNTVFPAICAEFTAHIENGAAVPSQNIPASADGEREWSSVRRFFVDRRRAEKEFVSSRLDDYQGVVEDLVSGLRKIGNRDQDTEDTVRRNLQDIETAINSGAIPIIKQALAQAIEKVNDTFTKQKKQYEAQLSELNERMSCLRQDLVAAREEMKRDPLTDAYNRGAFDQAIVQSLNMHFILNQTVTLVLIDLDNFKQINDNYGHSAGDDVLKQIGERLERSFIRKNDLVARYGGDEFAVILNDTSHTHAAPLIERFLDSANEIAIPGAEDGHTVSCSAGYTEIREGDTVTTLINRADRGLYDAKARGRNRAAYRSNSDDAA